MGEVYLATDTRLDRTVALKILSPALGDDTSRLMRFEREARAISALAHPHICTLYDIGEQDGIRFLVMEHLDGQTLAQRLRQGALPTNQALEVAAQIVDALEHAHRQRIIHRDLKPANVMLTRAGVKLLDFGVAKLCAAAESTVGPPAQTRHTETVTGEGVIVGTLNYMSPEQLEGGEIDARTDLFAFGAVLYEMLTGRQAFAGSNAASIAAKILRDDVPPPSRARASDAPGSPAGLPGSIPPLLDQIVSRCLAKQADERWQTASDLKHALKWIAQGNTAADATPPQPRTPRRRQLIAWSVAAAAIAIVTLISLAARALREPEVVSVPAARFEIHPPEDAGFGLSPAMMAISPDGRSVAFHGNGRDGVNALWIRSLDSLTSRRLPGTEGAVQPFWSAEGRHIAFAAEGRLKRIDVASGVVQTIHDTRLAAAAGGAQSGSWGAGGIILWRTEGGGLHQISESGGVPASATTLDLSREEHLHQWPQLLPDGRHFLYQARSAKPEYDGVVYLSSLDSHRPTPLFTSDSHVAYVEPGYLLYLRGNTLVAHAFNPTTRRLAGEPVPVVEGVDSNPATRRGAFSASHAGVLVYRPLEETRLSWFDRHGRRLEAIGPRAGFGNPDLSPDEQHLAIDRLDPATGTRDVWIVDLARSVWSRLTSDPASDEMPLWFPDGKRVLFKSLRGGEWSFYHRAANGTGQDELTLTVDYWSSPLGWTQGGRFLAYEGGNPQRSLAVSQVSIDNPGQPSVLLESKFGVRDAKLSPDGRWLAYASREGERSEIFVLPLSSGSERWQISTSGGIEPQWRGDGRELFYIAPDRSLMAVDVAAQPVFRAGPPRQLFVTRMVGFQAGSYFRNQYVVTADAQRFLLNEPVDAQASPITVVVNWMAALKK